MTILIIEDEAKAAAELEKVLKEVNPLLTIVGKIDSVENACKWLTNNEQPDVIFSDIQLADGLFFDIYQEIEIKSPVVFCTAFDMYMMDAFETNAISYLLKPISRQKVEKSLIKLESLKTAFAPEKSRMEMNRLMQQLKQPLKKALLVNQGEKIIPIQVSDIACFYFDKLIITITTFSNNEYLLSETLDDVEKMIDPALFYRANRQFIIHRNAVSNVERTFARKLNVKLPFKTRESIMVSKAKAQEFLKWLEGEV